MIVYDISDCMDRSIISLTLITLLLNTSWVISTSMSVCHIKLIIRIQLQSATNSMSISNLSIVFGPTLLGAPPEMGGLNLEHMSFQCKVRLYPQQRYSN
jgi:hypothetical protein